jgi:hypothetical protein
VFSVRRTPLEAQHEGAGRRKLIVAAITASTAIALSSAFWTPLPSIYSASAYVQ